MQTNVERVSAALACPPTDSDCFRQLATKTKSDGDGAYPCELKMLSCEVLDTPDGGRANIRLVLRNPTQVDFGAFETIVSPAVVLQGRPVERPPSILMQIKGLAANETALFFVNDFPIDLPADHRITCRDKDFKVPTT